MNSHSGKISTIILFIMLLFSSFLVFQQSRRIKSLINSEKLFQLYKEVREEDLSLGVSYSSAMMNDLLLLSFQGDTLKFGDIQKTGFRLVYRFDNSSCESCRQDLLRRLIEFNNNAGFADDVIVLGKYESINNIRLDINVLGTNNVYKVLGNPDQSQNIIKKAHLLLVDEKSRVRFVFIPNAYSPHEIDVFLDSVSKILKDN